MHFGSGTATDLFLSSRAFFVKSGWSSRISGGRAASFNKVIIDSRLVQSTTTLHVASGDLAARDGHALGDAGPHTRDRDGLDRAIGVRCAAWLN